MIVAVSVEDGLIECAANGPVANHYIPMYGFHLAIYVGF